MFNQIFRKIFETDAIIATYCKTHTILVKLKIIDKTFGNVGLKK